MLPLVLLLLRPDYILPLVGARYVLLGGIRDTSQNRRGLKFLKERKDTLVLQHPGNNKGLLTGLWDGTRKGGHSRLSLRQRYISPPSTREDSQRSDGGGARVQKRRSILVGAWRTAEPNTCIVVGRTLSTVGLDH